MPNALIALPDVYESVTRRVAVDVAKQLATLMRLPGETQVLLPGNAETLPMNGGSFGDVCDPSIRYASDTRLVMTYNEEVDEERTLTTPVNNQELMPLFLDEERDISIRPVYRYVTLTTSLEYTAPSLVIAQRWLDEMRSRVSMFRAEQYMILEYHYAVPRPVTALLQHLYEQIEGSAAPRGKTFEEYLEEFWLTPTTTATTLSGTSPLTVIPERQYEVLGWFDFTTSPQTPEKDGNGTGTYTASFTYTLHYNRPTQVYCQYPLLVHNELVGRPYRPQSVYETFHQVPRKVSRLKGSFERMMAVMRYTGISYIRHPEIDDWMPDYVPNERLTFFTGLLRLTPETPRQLLNLADLGEWVFNPYFLEYFYHQGDKLFDPSTSIFEFRLYENRRYRSDIPMTLDGVTLLATQDLDLTKYYHVQLSLRKNWWQLSPAALRCLRRYPTVLYLSLCALGVRLGQAERLEAVSLLAAHHPRPASAECPGEGSLIATWPWPWLGDEWADVPWPGGIEDGWEQTPWPGMDNPRAEHPDHGSVRDKDLTDAIRELGDLRNDRVGPLTVLYSEILSSKAKG